jgi:hypothetical protein
LFFRTLRAEYDNAQVRRFFGLEPIRLLAAAVGLTFLLLLAGFAAGAASGALTWQAAVTAAIALLMVAAGLLYAWRLGAPGRRR